MAKPIKCVKFVREVDGDLRSPGKDWWFNRPYICDAGLRSVFSVPQNAKKVWVSLFSRPSARRVKLVADVDGDEIVYWDVEAGRENIFDLELSDGCEELLGRLAKKTGRREFYAEVHYSLT